MLGTILAAVVVSKVMRPVYVLRYIYPVSAVAWTIWPYYYPDNQVKYVNLSELTDLEKGGYWLIVPERQETEDTIEILTEQGFSCEKVIDGGILGTSAVDIYHLWGYVDPDSMGSVLPGRTSLLLSSRFSDTL